MMTRLGICSDCFQKISVKETVNLALGSLLMIVSPSSKRRTPCFFTMTSGAGELGTQPCRSRHTTLGECSDVKRWARRTGSSAREKRAFKAGAGTNLSCWNLRCIHLEWKLLGMPSWHWIKDFLHQFVKEGTYRPKLRSRRLVQNQKVFSKKFKQDIRYQQALATC